MNNKTFYITTPIYYPNAKLHIGHAYTTVLADVLARYKKLNGFDVFFVTGSDEHGQKIETKAKESNLEPKQFVDPIIESFKSLWKTLGIEYNVFVRTTDEYHMVAVQTAFKKLFDSGHIYLGKYSGKYCVPCETFLTDSQLNEGSCPTCEREVIKVEEESYFLKLSNDKETITKLFDSKFIYPDSRRKELYNNFIEKGLEDLSISRTSFSWGIPIAGNEKHVIYVWLDALMNYVSALGYGTKDTTLLNKFWGENSEIVHLVGKEITRFHCIYWPLILDKLQLRQPTKVLAHGWLVTNEGQKMGKSLGNAVDPVSLLETYGRDTLRYYLAVNIPIGNDGEFREELVIDTFNSTLANNLGNLVSRTQQMIISYCNGTIPQVNEYDIHDDLLDVSFDNLKNNFFALMDDYKINEAYDLVREYSSDLNKYIDLTEPWVLAKDESKRKRLDTVLNKLAHGIYRLAILYQPILIDGSTKILNLFDFNSKLSFCDLEKDLSSVVISSEKEIIYKRITKDK